MSDTDDFPILAPYWNTKTMYNETVCFVGQEDSAKLLYNPTKILSVKSYTLGTEYVAGKDYFITNQGEIVRTAQSTMPFFAEEEYYRCQPDVIKIPVRDGIFKEPRFVKYGERDTFTQKQITVTYEHSDLWQGFVPVGQNEILRNTVAKVKSGKSLKMLFYGDSITVGCNASGTVYGGNTYPHTPPYDMLVTGYLEKKYQCKIERINTAVGGKNTKWGAENVQDNVVVFSPDVVILAFGMNDSFTSIDEYKQGISAMVYTIQTCVTDCEIILVGTTLPHPETTWYGNQEKFIFALEQVKAENNGVALANMTAVHKSFLSAGKRFRDMTGNNINHPNDFIVRAYAQVLLKTLLGDEFERG